MARNDDPAWFLNVPKDYKYVAEKPVSPRGKQTLRALIREFGPIEVLREISVFLDTEIDTPENIVNVDIDNDNDELGNAYWAPFLKARDLVLQAVKVMEKAPQSMTVHKVDHRGRGPGHIRGTESVPFWEGLMRPFVRNPLPPHPTADRPTARQPRRR